MTENLKRCPFCGGEAKCIEFYGLYHVICCNCYVAGKDCSTRESAVSAWNTRPIEDELHGRIEELESENKRLREALEFYALGKHLLKASSVVCDAYDIVSGQVENGKYAQEVLEGCAKRKSKTC